MTESVAEIAARQQSLPPKPFKIRIREEFEYRRPAKPNPFAPAVSHWPPLSKEELLRQPQGALSPQSSGVNFLATQISEGPGFIPPDAVGSVGPSQVVVVVNGRVKAFDKAGNIGPLNADLDVFFTSVLPVGTAGTSDPRAYYDRLSGRWFITCISVDTPNRILIAVSSGATISGSASFTFFYFTHDSVGATPNTDSGGFLDYETLGIDANALYIGGNVFNAAGTAFLGTTGFVVRKSSVLGGGPIVVTAFRQLATASGAGPYTPQGVNNDDPAATEGYFVGVDNASFSLLEMRRVSNPGGTPSISANISITVPTTQSPRTVSTLGSTRPLDGIDDRLFNAQIKNGSLWTVHNINVTSAGVATSTAGTTGRDAARWYEINNLSTTPTLHQSGTLFDNATVTSGTARHTWMPSIAVSQQNHVVIAHSIAAPTNNLGTQIQASVGHGGRLASDPLGTIQGTTITTPGAGNYNIQTTGTQRWGDYSFASVDPNDDMTIWSFAEYCNSTNSWGVRITQLLAPPPATPSSASPPSVNVSATNTNVVITGTSSSGSGFFDPGAGFANHISASVSGTGVTINSVTYADPTHATLNINVSAGAAAGARTVIITNPDGQFTPSATGILTITNGSCPTITLSPPTLPSGSVNVAYSQTITASGGTTQHSFAVTSGSLPTGLSLSSLGALTGTPARGGVANFTVTATDDSGCTGNLSYALTIVCPAITVSPASLPNGTVSSSYNQSITASGGASPYTFTVTSGSLPSGTTLSLGGALTGTPTGAGTFNFTTTATDADSCTGAKAYSLIIDPSGGGSSISLAAMGTPYTQDFNTLANSGTSSTLPSGWEMIESGANANATYTAGNGTGTAGDTYSFGSTSNSDRALGGLQSGNLNPTYGASFVNNTGATITSLDVAYTGEQWRLGATGRVDRIDFQLSIDATSLTSGTYTDYDNLDFTAPVTAGATGALDGNAGANRANISFTITGLSLANGAKFYIRWNDLNATGADDGLGVDDFSITPHGASSTNPSGSGTASPSTVTAGTSTLLIVTVLPGTNPTSTGLTVSGDLSSIGGGAPQLFYDDATHGDSISGDHKFSFAASIPLNSAPGGRNLPAYIADSQLRKDTIGIALTITCPVITLSPTTLPGDTVGKSYNAVITAAGGTPPYSFAISSGSLPGGVNLSTSGTISGSLATAESINVTISATDANGCSGTRPYSFIVYQGENISVNVPVQISWNMLSNPLVLENDSVEAMYPLATSSAFIYVPASGYQTASRLQNGLGAWLKFSASQNVNLIGHPIARDTVDVEDGWNLLGSISHDIAVTDITTIGTTIKSVFGFHGSYQTADSVIAGNAYWINVIGSGKCVFASGSKNPPTALSTKSFDGLSKLMFADGAGHTQTLYFAGARSTDGRNRYALPPLPPAGAFDVRFVSGQIAEFGNAESNKDFPILLSSAIYPVALAWNSPGGGVRAQLIVGGRTIPLSGDGQSSVDDPGADVKLRVLQGSPDLPKQFSLQQNYPNPFNPVTEIRYSVADSRHVNLRITNVLGEVIATLVNEVQEPGEYRVEWDASRTSSGVYYYQLVAGDFSEIKKMLLMK